MPHAWSHQRERAMRLWINQLVALSFLFMRAARFTRATVFWSNALSFLGALYTLPSNGCGLVSGEVCVQLQWSGIIIGLLSAISGGLSMVYDWSKQAEMYEQTQKSLMQLSRTISLELQKDRDERLQSGAAFAQDVVEKYDKAVENVRLPWYIQGEQQLANISLLQTYETIEMQRRQQSSVRSSVQTSEENSTSTSTHSSDTEPEIEPPHIELNDQDRAAMEKIAVELERLGATADHES